MFAGGGAKAPFLGILQGLISCCRNLYSLEGRRTMANKKHLDLLKKGVVVWNEWRREHPDIRPDFSRADLSGASLSGADLSGADFSGASLSETDLRRADLSGANLSETDLRRVNLSRANLSRADLSGAKDLTREQVESAVTDENTRLPDYLKAEAEPEAK